MYNKIFRYAAFLTLIILAETLSFNSQTPTIIGPQVASPNDVWELKYEVTIRGKGKVAPEVGSGDPEVSWVVDRTFKGGGTLSVRSWEKTREKTDTINFEGSPTGSIYILDSISKETDPTCEEYTVEDESWWINAEGRFYGTSTLTIVNSATTYDLNYILGYHPETTEGKGPYIGLPGKEIPIPASYKKQVTQFPRRVTKILSTGNTAGVIFTNLPTVNGWIEKGRLLLRKKIPLVQNSDGCFCFDSGELVVNQSLLPGVDTSGQVKIRIVYTLSKFSK